MKTFLAFAAFLITFALIACNKDKFQTTPRIEIKDYNSKEIRENESLIIRMNYFDKEGDLGKALITGMINRVNLLPISPGQDKADTIRNELPEFPDKDNGEIAFRLEYGFLKESIIENDTLVFKFTVQDRRGNTSDTITSDKVIIHLP